LAEGSSVSQVSATSSTLDIDVYVSGVFGVAGFQAGVIARDVNGAELNLAGVFVDDTRADYIFSGLENYPVTDEQFVHLGGVTMLIDVDVPDTEAAYIGTFQFQVPDGAAGPFTYEFNTKFTGLWGSDVHPVQVSVAG
jgi:hypothetical protein